MKTERFTMIYTFIIKVVICGLSKIQLKIRLYQTQYVVLWD